MDARRAQTHISFLWSLPASEDKRVPGMSKDQPAFFDALYQLYQPRVLAYMRFRVGTLDMAEDLTSQVFERALGHLPELQAPEAAPAWLFRIAHNCAADYFRKQHPALSLEELFETEHPRGLSPEEQVLADEERSILLAYVSRLPEREREIIGLKFVAHLTNRQIARVLNMPEGTVGSILYRTLGKLRNAFRAEGGTL
jgi:RNA polymerase sigma-70 factor (ECF subfamily)